MRRIPENQAIDAWAEFESNAQALSQDEFCDRHKHPFLILKFGPSAGRSSFVTESIASHAATPYQKRVVPVAKRLGANAFNFILIGRAKTCDIVIDDRSISKSHAIIRFRDGGYWVNDADSRNGLRVNGERLLRGQEHRLAIDDELGFSEDGSAVVVDARVARAWCRGAQALTPATRT